MVAMSLPDTGVVLTMSAALLWPAGATIVVVRRRRIFTPAWRVFLHVGLLALVAAGLLLAWSWMLFATNGTTRSMAALGPQIAGLTCLGGALLCGIAALVAWLRSRPPGER
jgi:hypothetical protein